MNKIIDDYQIFKESENINNILKHISTNVKFPRTSVRRTVEHLTAVERFKKRDQIRVTKKSGGNYELVSRL